jgi:hypothetical protein
VAAKICGICGAEFDDFGYSVRIEGVDGVFDRIRCALQAVARAKREERRAQLQRDVDAIVVRRDTGPKKIPG